MNDATVSNASFALALRLPDPPRYDLWPLTLQHAMRLRGALVACGPGVRGIAWPDSSRVRINTLGPWLEGGLVASHLTAAWVWGALEYVPSRLSVATFAGKGRKPSTPQVRHYELRLAPDDVEALGELHVTTPSRTVLDLLYSPTGFDAPQRTACTKLLRTQKELLERVRASVIHQHRPHSRIAKSRLMGILDHLAMTAPLDSTVPSSKE